MRQGLRPLVLGLAIATLMPSTASATPAFSRQIHADCRTCHFQGMHALNRFGRAFMMNNFSLSKSMRQELLERKKRERERRKKESDKKDR